MARYHRVTLTLEAEAMDSSDTGSRPGPTYAEWLATFSCPLRCDHCAAEAGVGRPDELSTAEAVEALDQVRDLGVRRLCVSGGEPTSRGDWLELLAEALARFDVAVLTNGWHGRGVARALEGLAGRDRLRLLVSVDGPERVHDRRRGAGSFARAVELLEATPPDRVDVVTTVCADNAEPDLLDEVRELCERLGVVGWTVQPGLPVGRLAAPRALPAERAAAFVADYLLSREARSPVRLSTSCPVRTLLRDRPGWQGCPAGRDQIALLPNGDVAGCVFLPACGNVRQEPLGSIWGGAAAEAWRRRASELCAGCTTCAGGCPAVDAIYGHQLCGQPGRAGSSGHGGPP